MLIFHISVQGLCAKVVCPTFGTDHLRYSVFSHFAERLFFDYSDAVIEFLDFITICKNRATDIDFYALSSRREKPLNTIFVSIGQAKDTLIC